MIPLNNISAVLWDMDGVLADTGEYHYQAMASTLASYRIEFAREIYLQTFGTNIQNVLTATLGEPPTREFVQEIVLAQGEAFCDLIKGELQLLPGVLDALDYFKSRGIKQAIASSSADFLIQATIDEIQIKDYFELVISGAHLPPKPNPDIFLHAADALQIPAEDCLVIEDSPSGVKGANSAGMHSLAVTNSHPRLKLKMADEVVNSLQDLFSPSSAKNT